MAPSSPTSPEPVEGRGTDEPAGRAPVAGRDAAARPSLRGPLLRFALLVVLVAAGFLLLRWDPVASRLDPEALTATFQRLAAQPWAPLALLAAYLLLCPLGAPVSPLMLAAGLVFGFAGGSALNLIGTWGGGAATYLLGRLLGKDFVEHLLGERLRRVERMVERHAFWTLVRLRFVPIPFALVNYAAALAGVRPAVFLSATALGLAPAVVLYTWFAVALFRLATTDPGNALPVILQLAAAFVLLFALTFLPRWFTRHNSEVSPKDGAPYPKKTGPKFQNDTEELVYHLCRNTFLSLWSYPNPQRDDGKELCDVLVVCDPDIIVISVKETQLQVGAQPDVAIKRWHKTAIENSVKQLYGAVRWLEMPDSRVLQQDKVERLRLPPTSLRRYHRISVSLGSHGLVPYRVGDYGKGFVHVLDERSVVLLMDNLDTITDFVDYLTAKEQLARSRQGLEVYGEENLLAIYLHRGRTFPENLPEGPIPAGLWDELAANRAYRAKVTEDEVSYLWDKLVEYFAQHALKRTFEIGNDLAENEQVFREMARESRFGRRILGDSLEQFIHLAEAGKVRSRMARSVRGTGYVFMNARPTDDRESRRMELTMRTLVARGELGCEIVIGLCLNVRPAPEGFCEDVVMIRIPEWTAEHQEQAERIKAELGYFADPEESHQHFEEYPED